MLQSIRKFPDEGCEDVGLLDQLAENIENFPEYRRYGRVAGVNGMLLDLGGMPREVAVGSRCEVVTQDRRRVACEIVGFRAGRALAMPFTALDGIGLQLQKSHQAYLQSDDV